MLTVLAERGPHARRPRAFAPEAREPAAAGAQGNFCRTRGANRGRRHPPPSGPRDRAARRASDGPSPFLERPCGALLRCASGRGASSRVCVARAAPVTSSWSSRSRRPLPAPGGPAFYAGVPEARRACGPSSVSRHDSRSRRGPRPPEGPSGDSAARSRLLSRPRVINQTARGAGRGRGVLLAPPRRWAPGRSGFRAGGGRWEAGVPAGAGAGAGVGGPEPSLGSSRVTRASPGAFPAGTECGGHVVWSVTFNSL